MSASTSGDILDIQDVGYAYGGVWAVKGCSFSIRAGEVTGLIGPNGAGKSTLIEMLSGTLTPRTGKLFFDGADITGMGPARVARAGIARTFQSARVLGPLPAIENVVLAAQGQVGENPLNALFRRGSWRQQEEDLRKEAAGLLAWLGLEHHLLSPAGTLSGGQRRLLEIARALMAHPKLLLLDEPTAGVFPETSQLIAKRVREIAAQGVTVLLIAHNMGFLEAVADDVVVMAEGRVLTRGPLEVVREHADVVSAYLGTASVKSSKSGPTQAQGVSE